MTNTYDSLSPSPSLFEASHLSPRAGLVSTPHREAEREHVCPQLNHQAPAAPSIASLCRMHTILIWNPAAVSAISPCSVPCVHSIEESAS